MKSARVPSFIKQVEVPAPVALLDVGEAVERVRERRPDPREQLEAVHDQRRLAASALGRLPDRADDVAEVHLHLAGARGRTEELDPAAAVDEVEEHELAHVPAREHAAGEPALLRAFDAGLERVRLGVHGRDLVPVGKALGERLRHGRLTIAQAFGPFSGVRPSRTTPKPCAS